ncbi:MAG TPA: hypothetical protein VIF15_09275 [Polyangiaceae bacterium]
MRLSIPILALATTLCLPALPACSSCGDQRADGVEAGAAVEAPVPAPDGLLAEGWIRAPDATWSRVQQGVSGAVALLPPSAGELACAFAGLEPHLAPLVDGKATSTFALADAGDGVVAWAVALPLTDPATATAMLVDGGDAQPSRYTSREEGGMRILAGRERPLSTAVALARGWLILARSDQDLTRLGPYLVRTMPVRTAPPSASSIIAVAPHSALAGPLASWLGAGWGSARGWLAARDDEQRAQHGGRPPDFGDPRAILDALDVVVKRRLELVADAQSARLEIDAQDDDLRADLFVTPGQGEAGAGLVASMRPGDAKPMAGAPADGLLAMMVRDDAEARADDAREIEAAVDRTLGARLHEEDSRAVHAAVDDWSRARGDWLSVGVAWDVVAPARGLWLRTPATSGDAAAQAVRELVELTRRPPLADLLAGTLRLGPPAIAPAQVPGLGTATLATFRPAQPAKAGRSPGGVDVPLGVGWAVHDGDLLVAMGQGAPRLLSGGASPARRLGDDARSARLLSALGATVTFALLAQPLRLDPGRPAQDAPALLAWGRREGDVWARLELADALLRELIRLEAGL